MGTFVLTEPDTSLQPTTDLDGLFRAHYGRLVRALGLACGDVELAADAVQEAFVRAHVRWRRIRHYEDPVGWIRRVAVNLLRDERRRSGRKRRAIERLGNRADAHVGPPEEPDQLDLLLRELPTQQRTARAGRQRAIRVGATVLSCAVLGIAGVVAIRSIDGGQEVVRTPATDPPVVTSPAPAPTTAAVPPSVAVSTTTLPGTATPTSDGSVTTTPSQAGYDSLGGSITVEQVGTTIRLLGEPQPASGYSVEVEDDGPDRVRVRFEDGERRSRITVELVDGMLVPQVDEE